MQLATIRKLLLIGTMDLVAMLIVLAVMLPIVGIDALAR